MSTSLVTLAAPLPLPAPRVPLDIRVATPADLPFIDGLQKRHAKAVGWMPRQQLEGKIAAGNVIVAEGGRTEDGGLRTECDAARPSSACTQSSVLSTQSSAPLGYLIAADRYFKHDDVGIIYQMNVVPGAQRALVGAALLAAQFGRSAYGCRLYCCWCAQDLVAANRFWAAMGFVPLAYRAGSRGRRRVHIFWQRRVRAGDAATPWWYPSQTGGGSLREDRLVLPIPPGVRWDDEMPRVLPGTERTEDSGLRTESKKGRPRALPGRTSSPSQSSVLSTQSSIVACGLRFAPPAASTAAPAKRPPRAKGMKNDPKRIAAARELRDRWLEQVNDGGARLEAAGKYEVGRTLCGAGFQLESVDNQAVTPAPPLPLLPAAAA